MASSSFFFDNICFQPSATDEYVSKDYTKGYSLDNVDSKEIHLQDSKELTFCGFYGIDAFGGDESRQEEAANSTRASVNSTAGSQRQSFKDTSIGNNQVDYYGEDEDDSTVVSSSGVSVLSIDYNNPEPIAEKGGKVDLSDIGDGDDESTIDSQGDEYDEYETIDAQPQMLDGTERKNDSNDNKELIAITSKPPTPSSMIPHPLMKRKQSDTSGTGSIFRTNVSLSSAHKKIGSSKSILNVPKVEAKRKELVKALRTNITSHGRYSLQVAQSLVRIGEFHELAGQNETSISLYQEALDIYRSKNGDHDANVTELQLRLGQSQYRLGNYNEALDIFTLVFFMISELSGEYDTTACDARVQIARIIHMKGFHKEAVKELKKALRGYREKHGDEHISVADTVDTIADFYSDSGNHTKANNVRGELVKLRVALHGTKSVEVATALEKWASAHEAIGDINGALGIMKQAYVMFHEIEGAEGINSEGTLEKIGIIYSLLGRSEKAIKAHTSVALTRKMRYGDHSVELAASYLMLGKAYMDDSNPERALKALNRAMSSYNRANGSGGEYQIELLDTLHTIGILHQKSENYQKALGCFNNERLVRKETMESDIMGMANVLRAIGSTYFAMTKYKEAKNACLEALKLYDKAEGRKLLFSENLVMIAEAIEGLKNKEKAMICYKDAVMIFLANGQEEGENKRMSAAIAKLKNMGMQVDTVSFSPSLRCSILDGHDKFEF